MCLKETLSYMTNQKISYLKLPGDFSSYEDAFMKTQMPPIMAICKDGQVHQDKKGLALTD